jgi:hypothetical protein
MVEKYIVYDATLDKSVGEPIDDYKKALDAALTYSMTEARGHVVRVRPEGMS